jgi:hypothetical protein
MVVNVTEDYIKTSDVSVGDMSFWKGNISTNWRVTDSNILLFPATHC